MAGGVCFHRGSSSGDSSFDDAEALMLVVLENWRMAGVFEPFLRTRAQLAHMKEGLVGFMVWYGNGLLRGEVHEEMS